MEKQISRKITLQSTKYVKTQYKFCAFFSFFELVLSGGEVSLPDRKYNDTVENVFSLKLDFFITGAGISTVGQYMYGIIHSTLICTLFDMESHSICCSFSVLF